MKTNRSCQLVYLNFLPSQTQNGLAFTFYAIDDFSQYAFFLDVTEHLNEHILFEQLKKLVQHEDFNTSLPFTIMAVAGIELEKDIQDFLKPLNGSITFDTEIVIAKTQSFVDHLNNSIG